MISITLLDADKKYFQQNRKAEMERKKLNQVEKQLQMLFTKRDYILANLYTMKHKP